MQELCWLPLLFGMLLTALLTWWYLKKKYRAEYESQIETLKSANKKLQSDIEGCKQKSQELNKENDDLKSRFDKLTLEVNQLKNEKSDLSAELKSLTDKNNDLVTEKNHLIAELENYKNISHENNTDKSALLGLVGSGVSTKTSDNLKVNKESEELAQKIKEPQKMQTKLHNQHILANYDTSIKADDINTEKDDKKSVKNTDVASVKKTNEVQSDFIGSVLGGSGLAVASNFISNSNDADKMKSGKSVINNQTNLKDTGNQVADKQENLEAISVSGVLFDADAAKKAIGKKVKQDDLTVVEGIGPKIQQLYHDAGIKTWQELSVTSIEQSKQILADAGNRFKMHDPSTWAEQADLAAKGQWEELVSLQDKLNGGRK